MKSMRFFLFCGLFLATFSLSAQTIPTADIDKIFNEHFKADGPGAAVQVTKGGKVIYQKAFGMANLELGVPLRPDHVFRIGSITKQFTAAAILQLEEQGKLSLQDDLTKFLPDYPTNGKHITVEQLLNHSSGIKSYTGMVAWTPEVHRKDFTPMGLVDFFKDQPMDFEPGQKHQYNNSGYVLLGVIIEKVSGQTYAEYLDQHFFKPLGMKNSYYDDQSLLIKNRATGYTQADGQETYTNAAFLSMTQPYAAGSLLSTVEDLCTWSEALHNGKVIGKAAYQKATTPLILPDGTNTGYGFGLSMSNLLGSAVVEHSGGIHGFLSDMEYLPNEQVCVAILTNCDCNPPSELTADVAALAIGKAKQPTAIPMEVAKMKEYEGVYENAEKEQRIIRIVDGQLQSKRQKGGTFTLKLFAPDQFFFENSFARATFVREKGGNKKITEVMVNDRKSPNTKWVKTDLPLPTDAPELALSEADLDKFVGEYILAPTFSIKAFREGKQLFCQATGQPKFEVFAKTPTRFFLKVVEAEIEFYADEKGVFHKMILFQNGAEMPGLRKQ